jgi:Trp operon repressor
MPKPKFDRTELNRRLRTGKSQKEIAQVLNVSDAAISRGKKELKNVVVSRRLGR